MQAIAHKKFLNGVIQIVHRRGRKKLLNQALDRTAREEATVRLGVMLGQVAGHKAALPMRHNDWKGWVAAGFEVKAGCGGESCNCGLLHIE